MQGTPPLHPTTHRHTMTDVFSMGPGQTDGDEADEPRDLRRVLQELQVQDALDR